MAQLFISYSHVDRAPIEKLTKILEEAGHTIWWDRHIHGGAAYARDIEAQLHKADAVIVAWSPDANKSDWVKDEAVYAHNAGKLVPITLTDGEAPIGFRQYQTINFDKWKGDGSSEAVQVLLRSIAHVTGGDAPPAPPPKTLFERMMSEPVYAAAGAAVVLLMAVSIWFLGDRGGGPNAADAQNAEQAAEEDHEVSIAVLPFADMSPEGNSEYFADGLSEELLNVLAGVDGLKVASRTSSFALKNEMLGVGEIAKRLKVNHVLEGSVRKMNNRVRITAQLIDAKEDKHLWSETYDRHLSDIFRIQDEIATAVVEALRGELGIDDSEKIEIKPSTENLDAYESYLQARELYLARGKANVYRSMQLFEHAVELDPDFAKGWEGLAGVYAIATSWGILDRDYSALSLVAAKRALDLDPDLSAPYAVIGLTYRTHYPTPWEESIDNLIKAIERDPKNTDPRLWLGMDYMAVGEFDKAIAAFDGCLEVDNAIKLCRKYRSLSYLIEGDAERAIADATLNAEEGYYSDFDAYIPYFLAKGERLLAFTISRTVNWWANYPHKELIAAMEAGDNPSPERIEKFMAWAEAQNINVQSHTNTMLTLRNYDALTVENWNNDYEIIWLPQFAHYRASPEFKQFAADLGLVDYWRANGFPPQCRSVSETDFACK